MSTSICAKAPGCSNGYRHTALGPVMDISRHARIRQWIYPLFEAPVFASDPRVAHFKITMSTDARAHANTPLAQRLISD